MIRMKSTILLTIDVALGYYFFVFAEVEPCMVNPIVPRRATRHACPTSSVGSRLFNSFALTLLAGPSLNLNGLSLFIENEGGYI